MSIISFVVSLDCMYIKKFTRPLFILIASFPLCPLSTVDCPAEETPKFLFDNKPESERLKFQFNSEQNTNTCRRAVAIRLLFGHGLLYVQVISLPTTSIVTLATRSRLEGHTLTLEQFAMAPTIPTCWARRFFSFDNGSPSGIHNVLCAYNFVKYRACSMFTCVPCVLNAD